MGGCRRVADEGQGGHGGEGELEQEAKCGVMASGGVVGGGGGGGVGGGGDAGGAGAALRDRQEGVLAARGVVRRRPSARFVCGDQV